MLQEFSNRISSRTNLTREESFAAAEEILQGGHDENAVARFLVALSEKGETADELAGFASALMKNVIRVEAPPNAVDLCGTGGSGLQRFNVSTAAAFVVAACGVPVAKHGNKGSRQSDGSFDLIEQLGLPVQLPPEVARDALKETGLAFLFARAYHPIMKNVVGARKKAGRRTIFNLVGPLCNPAGVSVQVIGTADKAKLGELARAIQLLGRRRALVVRGEPGIDEFSVSGTSEVIEVSPTSLRRFEWNPKLCGINVISYDSLLGEVGKENQPAFLNLIAGRASQNIQDIVALNAGAVLYAADRAKSIEEGHTSARACIVDGRMRGKFEEYKRFVLARCKG
ncbi:MAG: anthranilate phosphoribosyltransferase [Verrucomicrobiae bacterium]|nr:anthranilate phosphoribosyltransferase [Verrucomicrobiae bacterium]